MYGASPVSNTFDLDGKQQTGLFPYGYSGTRYWNGENRLINQTNNSATWNYLYDHLGRRVAKYTGSGASATGVVVFYDNWNPIADFTLASNAYTLDRTYTWGIDLSGTLQGAGGVGGLLAVEIESGVNAGVYYPTYDGNGNVSEYLDSSGSFVAHYEYGPFGEPATTPSGAIPGEFVHRFSTKPVDDETGYYYTDIGIMIP